MSQVAYRVGGIYDPQTAETSPPATILVEDGAITSVREKAPADIHVEDFSATVAIPGLVDAHTHLSIATPGPEREQAAAPVEERVLRALGYIERMLAEGVTSIRILGEPAWLDLRFRDAFAAGVFSGPRIFAAGRMLAPTHAEVSIVDAPADGPEVVQRVRQNLARRTDWIKLYATPSSLLGDPREAYYSRDELELIVGTAHRAGTPVAAHAHGGEAVDQLIELGVDTIEHGRYLEYRQLELMAAAGTRLCSTVGIGVYSDVARNGRTLEEALARSAQSVAAALELGVVVIPGTDAVHGHLRFELAALEHYGASRAEALRAATATAAEVVAPSRQLGLIAPSYLADFALLAGNPLDRELPPVHATCVAGNVVWRADARRDGLTRGEWPSNVSA
jgi:imidazolonepropionase-like amidohydrolase